MGDRDILHGSRAINRSDRQKDRETCNGWRLREANVGETPVKHAPFLRQAQAHAPESKVARLLLHRHGQTLIYRTQSCVLVDHAWIANRFLLIDHA